MGATRASGTQVGEEHILADFLTPLGKHECISKETEGYLFEEKKKIVKHLNFVNYT